MVNRVVQGQGRRGHVLVERPGSLPEEECTLRDSPHPPSSGARMKPWICAFTRRSCHQKWAKQQKCAEPSTGAKDEGDAPWTRAGLGLAPNHPGASSLPQGRGTYFFLSEIENRPGPSGSGGAQIFFFRSLERFNVALRARAGFQGNR